MSNDNSATAERSTLKKIWNVVSIIFVAIVVLLAVLLMGAKIIGLQTYEIVSGSMTPEYNVGDLVYVKSVDPKDIKVGDVITFVLNEQLTVVTHRVKAIDSESEHFTTQGDANPATTETVYFKNLVGKVVFKIPLLGYLSGWVQNPPGTYIAVTVGAVLLILVFLPDMIGKKGRNKSVDAVVVEEARPADISADDSDSDKDSAQ